MIIRRRVNRRLEIHKVYTRHKDKKKHRDNAKTVYLLSRRHSRSFPLIIILYASHIFPARSIDSDQSKNNFSFNSAFSRVMSHHLFPQDFARSWLLKRYISIYIIIYMYIDTANIFIKISNNST